MIRTGRFTAKMNNDFVVFLIGMRVNNWAAIRQWLPVARAMGPMLSYLYQHPDSGFLGATGPWLSPNFRDISTVQYWRSAEDLEHFARTDPALHPDAWQKFFKASYKGGAVGIWHETFQVKAGQFECVYGNMPVFGLAKATDHLPITQKSEQMRQRLANKEQV